MKLHLMQFVSETAAAADPVIGSLYRPPINDDGYIIPGGWDESIVFPDISVYTSQVLQSGFWMIVAKPDSNTSLAQHAACRLAWDNISAVILGGTMTGNDMSALYVTPVPAGAYNPWNGSPPPTPT